MRSDTTTEQLTKYLTDAHAIEEQALAQLRAAPDIAGDPELARIFREHLEQTEHQERRVRERLEAHGAKPSKLKDVAMATGGKGFILFARSQTDTPGKLAAHAFSYEALELASYELLQRVAERAGDEETAGTARAIGLEEQAMAARLEASFDRSVSASLPEEYVGDHRTELVRYLCDAHAIEAQAIQLLERGPRIGGDTELQRIYAEHLEQTRRHQELVEQRLSANFANPSQLKDAAMRLGGLNWAMFFQAQRDTAGKLAAFVFAFEHLEIGGYEQLKRVAGRAGDPETVTVAERILSEERAAAGRVAGEWDRAVDASLQAQGVA
jgi:ferritin-like metal-binding protein YciE